ncbi:transposase, partial [Rhizobium sp. 2TAF27]
VVYGLALRQTQGLMRSVAALMGFDIAVPDFSTLSRRSKGLALPSTKSGARASGPVYLVVDSTGLKVFGEGEWLENKHTIKVKRKRWRKLHIGLDLASGEIVCADLTTDDVGDPTALPGLLDQIDGPVAKFIADGAYDGAPTRDLL